MHRDEWVMLGVFLLLLLLWILGDQLAGIDSATTALVGLSVLLITGVLTWKGILHEKGAWDTLVWFAALVMMASFLNELGLIRQSSVKAALKSCGLSIFDAALSGKAPNAERRMPNALTYSSRL